MNCNHLVCVDPICFPNVDRRFSSRSHRLWQAILSCDGTQCNFFFYSNKGRFNVTLIKSKRFIIRQVRPMQWRNYLIRITRLITSNAQYFINLFCMNLLTWTTAQIALNDQMYSVIYVIFQAKIYTTQKLYWNLHVQIWNNPNGQMLK